MKLLRGRLQTVPIVIVGTKLDLVNEREVPRATIQSLCNRWDLAFYETSAKRNWHVAEVFEDLLRQMRTRYPETRGKEKRKTRSCVVM
jgi:Ras-related protein Rap-1A